MKNAQLILFQPLAVCLFLAGCSEELQTRYGQRRGPGASRSVNGTGVLGHMFEQAGHTVYSWHALSPRVGQRADCILWFPDDFAPPGEPVCDWFESWLTAEPGRTLVCVGRDFDAAPLYWQQVLPGAPPQQAAEIRRRLTAAQSEFQTARKALVHGAECYWFTVDDSSHRRSVRTLQGKRKWLEGIDPGKLQIELRSGIEPSHWFETLLESEGDTLVCREPYHDSQLLLVVNGSFLLNLPLVNHEHRKLAGRLIEQVGRPGQTVVFLESGAGGPAIHDEDPSVHPPTGMEALGRPPMLWVFLHLSLAGVIFCFSRWPIFGLPRRLRPQRRLDFGRHIHALAELLERSGDRTYAESRVEHYRQMIGPSDER